MSPILKVILLTCFIISYSLYAHSQTREEPAVSLKSEYVGSGEKRTLNINATLSKPGSYSVLITFLEQQNINEPQRLLRVVKGPGMILRINPVDKNQPFRCRYRYSYTPGYEPKNIDSAFVYRLPYSTNREELVRVNKLHNVGQRFFNSSKSINWNALHFHLEKGDTIFAIRKGEVIKIQDGYEPADREENISYSSSVNSIAVEHTDGSICYYKVLEKGSFMVSEGDIVYPGTPLALCGLQNVSKGDYQLKLSIHYPVLNPDFDIDDSKSPTFLHTYYNPVFATNQGEIKLTPGSKYMAVSSQELVEKEMTNKELKKR